MSDSGMINMNFPHVRWAGGSRTASIRIAKDMLYQAHTLGLCEGTIIKCLDCGKKIPPAREGYAYCDSCSRKIQKESERELKEAKEREDRENEISREACRLSYLCNVCHERPKFGPYLCCEECLNK